MPFPRVSHMPLLRVLEAPYRPVSGLLCFVRVFEMTIRQVLSVPPCTRVEMPSFRRVLDTPPRRLWEVPLPPVLEVPFPRPSDVMLRTGGICVIVPAGWKVPFRRVLDMPFRRL